MAEYIENALQTVEVGQNVLLDASIPCNKGYVIHRPGSGILTLRGIVNNACGCFARYQVTFNGNIAVPDGEVAGEISIALALSGEPIQSSRARVTPAAVEEYFNVTSTAFITVPKGCCFTLAVENTSDIPIDVENANLVVSRVA
jgi:threonine dehydrogenase-like Zn-dependent dehydrogenase